VLDIEPLIPPEILPTRPASKDTVSDSPEEDIPISEVNDTATGEKGAVGDAYITAIREEARRVGWRLEAHRPHQLAEWLLDQIARGIFTDSREAIHAL